MSSAFFGSALASLSLLAVLQAGVESDTAIQNSVMRLAKQQGQSPAQLEQYLIRLHQLGLKPEEQTYNILLRAYAEHGDLKAAAEILDRMGADGTHLRLVVLILFNLLHALRESPSWLTFGLCNRMTACCMSAHRKERESWLLLALNTMLVESVQMQR